MDFYEILKDPDFTAEQTIISVVKGVDNRGRTTETKTEKTIVAAVQPAGPKEIETLPEAERDKASLSIWTTSPVEIDCRLFYGAAWHQVRSVEMWPAFGEQVYRCVAVRIDVP